MLLAAKIRVCPVVYTDVADWVPAATRPCRSGGFRQKNDWPVKDAYSCLLEVDPLVCRGLSALVAQSMGEGAGTVPAIRLDRGMWIEALPQPWTTAMEAIMFAAWIYDHLLPHAAAVKLEHPL